MSAAPPPAKSQHPLAFSQCFVAQSRPQTFSLPGSPSSSCGGGSRGGSELELIPSPPPGLVSQSLSSHLRLAAPQFEKGGKVNPIVRAHLRKLTLDFNSQ